MVTFLGLVRNHNVGRRVRYLEYEAYEPLALKTFERIAGEVRSRWPGYGWRCIIASARLEIGEASVAIAAASAHRGRRLRRLPVRDRTREADRADLEARVFRGRRCLDRGRDRRSGRRAARAGGGAGGMRVTVRLFARLRDIAGAAELSRDIPPGRDDRERLAAARRRISGARAVRAVDFESPSTPTTRAWISVLRDGDEVAFLPPVSGG